MGLLDSLKDRFSANLKFTRLSFMTQPHEIITFCQGLTPAERSSVIKGIESQFRWHSVAQVAQAMFPSYNYGSGVSAEALDMVKGGQISGGMELMRMQNQAVAQPGWGMMPAQQAALSFAWMVLKEIEQRETALAYGAPPADQQSEVQDASDTTYCTYCGTRRKPGRYCINCGARF
jgi:hypothetical protein